MAKPWTNIQADIYLLAFVVMTIWNQFKVIFYKSLLEITIIEDYQSNVAFD